MSYFCAQSVKVTLSPAAGALRKVASGMRTD